MSARRGEGRIALDAALAEAARPGLARRHASADERIRSLPSFRQQGLEMPILMLTAKGQEEDIVRGLELGADDYITKPFSIRELLAPAAAFSGGRSQSSETYEFGCAAGPRLAQALPRRRRSAAHHQRVSPAWSSSSKRPDEPSPATTS